MGGPYTWLAGRQGTGMVAFRRLYIYHLPKTGTSTVFTALMAAIEFQCGVISRRVPGFVPPIVGRVGDHRCADRRPNDANAVLLASHCPFGYHERFRVDFDLMTVLRDPFERVLSDYTYGCMRAGRPPTAAAFRDFYRAPENANVMTKQLAGLDPQQMADAGNVRTAIDRLRDRFLLYGTSRDIPALCEAYLAVCRLPNVIVDRLNRTDPAYRLDGRLFEAEIRDLNRLDQALYLFARDHPRTAIEGAGAPAGAVSDATVLVKQVRNDSAMKGHFGGIPTNSIHPGDRRRNFDTELFEDLFSRFRPMWLQGQAHPAGNP